MDIKKVYITVFLFIGIVFGGYMFVTTGSYFLLLLGVVLGYLGGYLLGNEAKLSKLEKACKLTDRLSSCTQ